MKRVLLVLLVLAVVAGGSYAAYRWFGRGRGDGAIRASGNVEVTQVQVSFRLAGQVKERAIDEGQIVKAGQLAAKLDDSELLREVQQRQAAVEVAKAALAELEAGSRPEEIAAAEAAAQRAKAVLDEAVAGPRKQEIAAAEAVVERARAEVSFRELDYKRMQETFRTGGATRSEYDVARTALEVVKAQLSEAEQRLKLLQAGTRVEQVEQAKSALAESQQRAALVKKGPRAEQIDQARGRLKEAQEALELARTRLGFATLACPVGGVVLSKNVEAGEFVAAGTPIVTVGDLKDVWVRAYIEGPDLGKVKLGQPAGVSTDSFPGKTYRGRVSFIASEAEFTPKTVQTEKERVKLVYRIKVDIENPDMELKPGMPADVVIGSR